MKIVEWRGRRWELHWDSGATAILRNSNKKRSCDECRAEIGEGQPYFSGGHSHGYRNFCMRCAKTRGLIEEA